MAKLPEEAEWLLSNNFRSTPPFAVLTVNFHSMTGSIKAWKTVEQLSNVHLLADEEGFWSAYSIGGNRGRFEATIDEKGVLNIVFSTGTIKNDFTARPTRIDWAGRKAYSARVVGLSYAERLGEAIARALPLMPADVAEQVGALKSPQTLSIMAATTVAWAVSHFFGVGEVADLVLLVAGGCLLGAAAADVAYDLNAFAKHVFDAKSEEDLDLAGQRFAAAVAKGTVNLVAAILLRRFAKSRPFRDLFQGRQPFNPRTGAPLKSTPGKWFYRPKFLRDARVPVGERGYTTPEGDIALSKDPRQFASGRPLALERLKTYFHERMHSFLTPRLQFMRDLRVQLRMGGYARSYLLRYLEEALCEAWGRFNSIGETPKAIRFPVDRGYVTVAKMGEEAAGVLQGSINVGGMIFRVFLAEDGKNRSIEYEYKDCTATLGE